MSQMPPPPAGPPAGARPTLVTVAAVLLFIGGALGVLAGIVLFGVGGGFAAIGAVMLIVSALQIYAGTQILAGKEQGRMLGLILAGLGAVFALTTIGQQPAQAIASVAINGFVIYALVQNAAYFKR